MADVGRAAKTNASVLLIGESGTGKEVFARAIHEQSARAEQPIETVDCASLMPTLVASELFGHEKGSFTGAEHRHIGAFERANGGTLFLDEIGELPLQLQAALLGALERRSFRRVGGTSPIGVDVRVVCATNRDLREEVNAGRFREDLYYRIAVVTVRLPPLRERLDDLPLLIEHFLGELGHEGGQELLSPSSMEALKKYRWPGNVRELRNFVEATLAMGSAPALHESEARGGEASESLDLPIAELIEQPYKVARERVVNDFERLYLTRLFERCSQNVSEASRTSKIDRSYLTQLLRRHGLR
jgi:DNA-binding NtrC family response regulator